MQHDANGFRVAVLGGSAGGLEPFMTILGHLRTDSGAAFVVAQHRSPHLPQLLPEILSRVTAMPVIEIEQGMRIEPDHVYIVPPRMQLLTEDETFILRAEPRLDGWPKTINVLLRSMAASLGPRLVAVILSGMDADGAAALSVVKAAGGVTFTQADAQYDSMPKNARATGCVDYVMSAREIAQALNDLGNGTLGRLHPRIRQVS